MSARGSPASPQDLSLSPNERPAPTLASGPFTAYKLLKRRKDGSLGPLFINASLRVPIGEWLDAEDHPTKGFAHRPGWHCCWSPNAPHLTMNPKGGPERVWCRVEVDDIQTYARPAAQGGEWVLAQRMRVVEVV